MLFVFSICFCLWAEFHIIILISFDIFSVISWYIPINYHKKVKNWSKEPNLIITNYFIQSLVLVTTLFILLARPRYEFSVLVNGCCLKIVFFVIKIETSRKVHSRIQFDYPSVKKTKKSPPWHSHCESILLSGSITTLLQEGRDLQCK